MAKQELPIADKTTLDAIKAILQNGTYGNSALNTDLDSIISKLDNGTFGLNALKTVENNIYNMLNNATYGLSAIKTVASGSYQNMKRYAATTVVTDTDQSVKSGYVYSTLLYTHTYNRTRALNNISITGKGRILCETACPVGTQNVDFSEQPGYRGLSGKSYLPTNIVVNIDGYNINATFANLFLKAGCILEFNKNFSVTLSGGTASANNQTQQNSTAGVRAAASSTYTHFACYCLM